MKIFAASILLVVACNAFAGDAGRYLATAHDHTIRALTRRVASLDRTPLKWDAHIDFRLLNAVTFNQEAQLSDATTAVDAARRIVSNVHRVRPKDRELFVCEGEAGIVIRQAGQKACAAPDERPAARDDSPDARH